MATFVAGVLIPTAGAVAQATPQPGGQFTAVSAGYHYSCGLRTDATVECWGDNEHGQADAPDGQFTAVSAGGAHSCGLRTDGTAECWGGNWFGQADAPDGQFTAVSAGSRHSCGLRADGTAECWGDSGYMDVELADAPGGRFTAVSAGSWHSCGLRPDGTAECWYTTGRDISHTGEAEAPGGQFTAISAGHHYSCGLRTDGTAECWGSNTHPSEGGWTGQAEAPGGRFAAISAGGSHSCGLRADDTVICWGDNEYGQAPATHQADGTGSNRLEARIALSVSEPVAVVPFTLGIIPDEILNSGRSPTEAEIDRQFSVLDSGYGAAYGIYLDHHSDCFVPCRLVEVTLENVPPGEYKHQWRSNSDEGESYFREHYPIAPYLVDDLSLRAARYSRVDGYSMVHDGRAVANYYEIIPDFPGSIGFSILGIGRDAGFEVTSEFVSLDGQVPIPREMPASAEVIFGRGEIFERGDVYGGFAPVENWLIHPEDLDRLYDRELDRMLDSLISQTGYAHWMDITLKNFPAGDYWVTCMGDPGPETDYGPMLGTGKISHNGNERTTFSRMCFYGDGSGVRVGSLRGRHRRSGEDGKLGERIGAIGQTLGGPLDVPGKPRLDLEMVGDSRFEIVVSPPNEPRVRDILSYSIAVTREPTFRSRRIAHWLQFITAPSEQDASEPDIFLVATDDLVLMNGLDDYIMEYSAEPKWTYTVSVAAGNARGFGPKAIGHITTPFCPSGSKYEIRDQNIYAVETFAAGPPQTFQRDDQANVVWSGEKGGRVSGEHTLARSGCSWIAKDAQVGDASSVNDNAFVFDNAAVSDDALVYEDARVFGNAKVYGDARVYGKARVYGDARVSGDAKVYGKARVYGDARVSGDAKVYGNAEVYGDARVSGDAKVYGNAGVYGDAEVSGYAIVRGAASLGNGIKIDDGLYDGYTEYRRAAKEIYDTLFASTYDMVEDANSTCKSLEGRLALSEGQVSLVVVTLIHPDPGLESSVLSFVEDLLFRLRACETIRSVLDIVKEVTPGTLDLILDWGLPFLKAAKLAPFVTSVLEIIDLLNDAADIKRAADIKATSIAAAKVVERFESGDYPHVPDGYPPART